MMASKAILIYGNTCAGKSTLGKLIETTTKIPYLSFGDLKRGAIRNSTPEGLRVALQSNAELPMNAQDVWSILQPHLNHSIFQLSGFPISSEELQLFLQHNEIIGVIFLTVPEEAIRRRYQNRAVCPECLTPGILGGLCTKHSRTLEVREDTNEQELSRRLKLNRRIEVFINESRILETFPSLILDGTLPIDSCASKTLDWVTGLIKEAQNVHTNYQTRTSHKSDRQLQSDM